MPITRNSSQKRKTLVQFYTEISQDSHPDASLSGKMMLELLEMINDMFVETTLWGLTSIARLVIQAQDDWKSPWHILISAYRNEFHFEYLLPPGKSPWKDAHVVGNASSLAEARRYLIIAMQECGGWSGNPELASLLDRYVR